MQPIINYIRNPKAILSSLTVKFYWLFSDAAYLKIRYYLYFGKRLDLKNPQTFSEKLQWLKLYNRRPEYTTMVDKYAVKDYVKSIIGEEYIIPTLGVWDRPEDIDFDSLPDKFVLKTTHGGGGGGVIICKNKAKLEKQETFSKLNQSLKSDIYKKLKEWPYKNVQKRIIAEQLIKNDSIGELRDYKFFCFHGQVKFFKIDMGRFIEHHANYYTPEGELLPFGEKDFMPDVSAEVEMPKQLNKMIKLAETLSGNLPFLRVDFYETDRNIYFGELTFYPASGMGKFSPDEWDLKFGKLIKLPNKN